jgi:predicted methyltransferase
MKKILLFSVLFTLSLAVFAQSAETDSMSIQAAIDACVQMRDAVATGDRGAIQRSADELKACNTSNFSSLRCKDDTISSLNGHLVFDDVFADSLAEGRDVYQHADEISRSASTRGQTADGSIVTKTCMVKAGGTTKYSFVASGRQELAVVAEAGGLVTMRIHVRNSAGLDERHDDTVDVKKGRSQRKVVFDLPKSPRCTVELEVVNCGGKDCSFVVISN